MQFLFLVQKFLFTSELVFSQFTVSIFTSFNIIRINFLDFSFFLSIETEVWNQISYGCDRILTLILLNNSSSNLILSNFLWALSNFFSSLAILAFISSALFILSFSRMAAFLFSSLSRLLCSFCCLAVNSLFLQVQVTSVTKHLFQIMSET